MTPEEQNRAIAEWMGWKRAPEHDYVSHRFYEKTVRVWTLDSVRLFPEDELPNFVGSLDVIAEARRKLTDDQARIFLAYLMPGRPVKGLASVEDFWNTFNASAYRQSEALLRTIGKWMDDTPTR